MSYRPRWDAGNWKATCDSCGRIFKASELRQRWDGLMVCNADWEPRQPQDFVRGVADWQAPAYTRPEASDKFVTIKYDRYTDDNVYLSDAHSFNFVKDINPVNITAYVVNGFSLNSHSVNASVTSSNNNQEDIRIEDTMPAIVTGKQIGRAHV